jgi:hypothetical protein
MSGFTEGMEAVRQTPDAAMRARDDADQRNLHSFEDQGRDDKGRFTAVHNTESDVNTDLMARRLQWARGQGGTADRYRGCEQPAGAQDRAAAGTVLNLRRGANRCVFVGGGSEWQMSRDSDLYGEDVRLWSETQGALLRRLSAGEAVTDQVDWPHVIEEVEDLVDEI